MSLPKIKLPSEEVLLSDGSKIRVSGITRKQAMETAQGLDQDNMDLAAVECTYLAYGLGLPEDEVKEWYAVAPAKDVLTLVDTVFRLSGMDEKTPKA